MESSSYKLDFYDKSDEVIRPSEKENKYVAKFGVIGERFPKPEKPKKNGQKLYSWFNRGGWSGLHSNGSTSGRRYFDGLMENKKQNGYYNNSFPNLDYGTNTIMEEHFRDQYSRQQYSEGSLKFPKTTGPLNFVLPYGESIENHEASRNSRNDRRLIIEEQAVPTNLSKPIPSEHQAQLGGRDTGRTRAKKKGISSSNKTKKKRKKKKRKKKRRNNPV